MAENLIIKIIGDASKLTSELEKAGGNVKSFSEKIGSIGRNMTIVGGAVTAAFALIIKKTVDAGDAFNDMSLRTGVAVEELSALAYAAKQSGTDIEAVETGLKFLTRAMDDTSKGIGTAKDTFAALGISVTDAEGKLRPTVEVMKDVATAVAAIDDPAKQAAVAMELFGARSGTQLVPLLKLGEGGIDDLMKKAQELGIVMSTESAQAADEFKDKMNDLKESLGAVGRDIANVLIPPLLELANKAVEMVKNIRDWADAHKPLVDMLVKVAATVGVLAAAGGPVLLAASAFLKMKGIVDLIVPSMKAAEAGTISLGGVLALGIANILIWTQVWKELNEILHSHRVTAQDVADAENNLADAQQKLADKLGITVEKVKEFQAQGFAVHEMINGIKDATSGVGESFTDMAGALDIVNAKMIESGANISGFGRGINLLTMEWTESFDDWVKRTTEANKAIVKSTGEFANTMKPIYDRLYEMYHTAEEIAVRSLNAQKAAQEEAVKALNLSADAQAVALAKIAELYNIEVGLIIKKLEEERDKQIEVVKTTEIGADAIAVAIRKIKGEYDPLIAKVNELATVTESSAARQIRAYERIYDAAGKLTTIKLPGGGVISTEAIVSPNVGPGYYAGPTPTLQTGTSLVTKTGLAIIDKGEAVLTPEQNKAYQSGGNHFIVNINNPIVRNDNDITKIRNEVNKALDEGRRQFLRRGSELALGM